MLNEVQPFLEGDTIVNVCLEMLEAEQNPVQMMDKERKRLFSWHTSGKPAGLWKNLIS